MRSRSLQGLWAMLETSGTSRSSSPISQGTCRSETSLCRGRRAFSIAHRSELLNRWRPGQEYRAPADVKENLAKVYQHLFLAKDYILRRRISIRMPQFELYSIPHLLDLSWNGTLRQRESRSQEILSVRQIRVDPSQMEDVFTNLIVNAYQAMAKARSLSIDLRRKKEISLFFFGRGPGIRPARSIYELFIRRKRMERIWPLSSQRVIKAIADPSMPRTGRAGSNVFDQITDPVKRSQ